MAGIEIFDQNGKLQFNGDMLTFAVRYSGTAYVEVGQVGNTCPHRLTLPIVYNPASHQMIAIAGGNGCAVAAAGVDGYARRIFAADAPVGTPFYYYVFEKSSNIPPSNFGIEVKNAAGEITFSTNHRGLKILDLLVGGGGLSTSAPGRSLAFCQANFAIHRIAGGIQYFAGGPGGGHEIPVDGDADNPPPGTRFGWQNNGKLYGAKVVNNGQTVQTQEVSYDDVFIGPQEELPAPDFVIPAYIFTIDVTNIPIGMTFF